MLALLSNLLPSSPDKKGLQQNVNVDYTLADFDTRQAVLVNYNNGTTKKEDLIQQIRKLAEIVVFSEQRHNQAVIDRFFEKSSIGILKNICLDPATSVEVQVQILQTISILIQSVREDMNVYQILSQNHVNLVIAHTFPFATAPEELLAHYISLLKTLAIRMDNEMCQLFFDSSKHGFPLYDSAMLLFANDESLVRAAVRSVVLMVRRITDEAVRQYVDSRQDYVIRMLQFLTHRQEKLLLLLKEQVNDYAWMVKLQGLMSDLLDDFVFLEDILAMRRSSQDLASEVFNSMVIEHMVDPLVNRTFHLNSNNREVALSIWLLCQFCYVIKEPLLLQHIFQSIFVTGGGYQLMLHVDDRICLAISCLAFMLVDHPALVVLKGGFQSRKSFPIIIDSQLLLANPSNSSVPSLNFDQDVLHRQREKDLNSSIDIGNELDAKREENKTKNPTPTIIEGDDESSVNVVEPSDAEVLANATLATAVRSEEKTKKKKKKKGQIVKREEQQQEEALPTTNLKEDQKEEDEEEVAVYPLQLVEYCLQALISRTDPPPNQPLSRSSTVRLLAKLLVHVTYDSRLLDDNNTKLDNTSSSSFLNTNHSHMLRKAITNSVHRFHNLITKPNTETLSVVETFEDEWRELKSGPLKVPSLLTNPGVLLSPEDEPRDNNEQKLKTLFFEYIPLPLRPVTHRMDELRIVENIFMIMRLCFASLEKTPDKLLPTLGNMDFDQGIWKEEATVDLIKLEFLEVTVLNNKMRMLFVLKDGAFMLVEPRDDKKLMGVCRSIAPVHRIDVGKDLHDSTVLLLGVRSPRKIGCATMKNKHTWVLNIKFESEPKAQFARDQIETATKKFRQEKFDGIVNMLETS